MTKLKPVLLLFLASVMAGGMAVLFRFDPAHYRLYPTCMLHQLTGLYCPGCGALRAGHHLLHGRVGVALQYNALMVVSLPFMAWGVLHVVRHGWSTVPRIRPVWLWTALAVLIAFGLLRNLPFPELAWLAPPP